MQVLNVDDKGFLETARGLIDSGEPFQVEVTGWKAKAIGPFMPNAGFALTGIEFVLFSMVVVLGSLFAYAVYKGRKVRFKGKGPGGTSMDFRID